MATENEALLNAETAFSNKQYNEALKWYQKVLEDTPNDIYALSRAGAICVPLGKYEDALVYFKKAVDLGPDNGDNYFNYGNACFFNKDNVAAFDSYVEAEKVGCSDDVTPRLYYQLALLCGMREDIKSALIYFKKCEDVDKEGTIALKPDFISEKMKLYVMDQDFENAEKCAAQFVAIQPSEMNSYLIYYGMLLATKKYNIAEKVLKDAAMYAATTDEDRLNITLQMASLLVAKGNEDPDKKMDYYQDSVNLMKKAYSVGSLTAEQKCQILLALADVYLKMEKYQESIDCLNLLMAGAVPPKKVERPSAPADPGKLSYDEIEQMIFADTEAIRQKIASGELDGNMGMYAAVQYDEEGREVRSYSSDAFDAVFEKLESGVSDAKTTTENTEPYELSIDMKERAYFEYLSAYMGLDNFDPAKRYAEILKLSDNKYYAYFGKYSTALLTRKIFGDSAEDTRSIYDETLAFFRSKSFEDPKDSLAALFRARLYAEDHKTAKAKEIAELLSTDDREAVLKYIETCGE